ncbi:GNAT family N-acetyltransferase [Pseudoalteromonas sp. MMG012]|uniref:GNAT family N-acetyltransferase n=1 Tax=Pseudoalteromonas sp. MMG012 TaxID=2822686 RepID=UPI001B39F7FE|nr:GNAT family N-acetyltransferase [Pseudoalteromonas sp. MMG012]MBQ4852059.1 GNAT family N-acetyltransferase [Pseudoalteromonas sp. MMG012]
MVLQTTRLFLRPISHRDIDALLRLLNEPLIAQYNDYGQTVSRDEAKSLIQWDLEQAYQGTGTRFVIINKISNEFIGTLGVYDHDIIKKHCFLGFELAPSEWGKGIMREALECLFNYLLENIAQNGLPLLVRAQVESLNKNCIKLLTRLMFTQSNVNEYILLLEASGEADPNAMYEQVADTLLLDQM